MTTAVPPEQASKPGCGRPLLGLVVLVVLVVAGVVGWAYFTFDGSPEADAFRGCKEAVTEKLKAPSTATFAAQSDDAVTIVDEGIDDGTNYEAGGTLHRVSLWVDAENSFGARLRQTFSCQIWQKDDEWVAVSVTELTG